MANLQKKVLTSDRKLKALEMRKKGISLQEIADELGFSSPSATAKAITAALEYVLREPAEELRTLELIRLDAMFKVCYDEILAGNLDAVEKGLKVQARRAKLLGLDMPEKVDMTSGGQSVAPALINIYLPENGR
jgi:transcriptional regulator